ncbi:MAG: SAM-dependent methyltransferase [Nitrosomonadales bacterium]|nr:MAG: SAM-dependent methyltransferase [Nitrosomonadales bacterium]
MSTETEWLETPLGRYVFEREQHYFDQTVADIFGFNAVQLGLPGQDFLRNSRIPYLFKAAPQGDVKTRCETGQLPFAAHSIDLLLLPHALEFADNPHQVLREAERVLLPEGHVVLSGFNPFSLWGARHACCKRSDYPWNGHFISLPRLKDWLALLGFEVVGGRMSCYAPPLTSEQWRARFAFLDGAGDRWWPMMGGVYFLTAKKRVPGMRLIRPNWNGAKVAQVFAPRPTQRTECQKNGQEQSQ